MRFLTFTQFVLPQAVPFFQRMIWRAKRFFAWIFRRPLPCTYVPRKRPQSLGHGYMILEYIGEDKAQMLSNTWYNPHDNIRRTNFFRDLSRVTLTLARHSSPHIGSLRIDDKGFIHTKNRPLTLRLQHLENEGIPTNISRDQLYFTSNTYILDLLACYDNKLRYQPNAIHNDFDGRDQMATVTAMRAIHSHYLQNSLRHGPFILMLTDLHHSNIFVDDNWNIKYIVDLEWACFQPVEMLRVPLWLTNQPLDYLAPDEGLEEFTKAHDEFLDIFEQEEEAMMESKPLFPHTLSEIIRMGWKNGNPWFFSAIEAPKGLCTLFLDHLQQRYGDPDNPNFVNVFSPYWDMDGTQVINAKIKDKDDYANKLRKLFAETEEAKPS